MAMQHSIPETPVYLTCAQVPPASSHSIMAAAARAAGPFFTVRGGMAGCEKTISLDLSATGLNVRPWHVRHQGASSTPASDRLVEDGAVVRVEDDLHRLVAEHERSEARLHHPAGNGGGMRAAAAHPVMGLAHIGSF